MNNLKRRTTRFFEQNINNYQTIRVYRHLFRNRNLITLKDILKHFTIKTLYYRKSFLLKRPVRFKVLTLTVDLLLREKNNIRTILRKTNKPSVTTAVKHNCTNDYSCTFIGWLDDGLTSDGK